jgi:hypothetical protein
VADADDELLADLLDRVNEVPNRDHGTLDGVLKRADMITRNVFGDTSEYRTQISKLHFSPMVHPADEKYYESSWSGGINGLRNIIQTMIEERKLFGVCKHWTTSMAP